MTDIKHIHFERSGGLTGLTLSCTVDTGSLDSSSVEQIRNLISQADTAHESAVIASEKQQPDRFIYRITIENDDQTKVIIMHETEVPAMLQPLIRHMTAIARKKGIKGLRKA